MQRSYSEKFFSGNSEAESRNVAVEWLRNRSSVLCAAYVVLLVVCYALFANFYAPRTASSLTNAIHGLISFLGLHWAKGSPDAVAQGEYDALTVWEQIDGGRPWTSTKRTFMLVPTIAMLLALNAVNFDKIYMAVNLPFYFLCIIPKLPQLHRVRLFGINRTVGIDDVVKSS